MITIDDLLGIKYTPNGRNKREGFDCYGLAIEVCRRFGHELFDVGTDYENSGQFNTRELICTQRTKLQQVNAPQKEGDLILLRDTDGVVSHIGVYLGDGLFIHCNKHGVHVDKVINFKKLIGRVYSWLQ